MHGWVILLRSEPALAIGVKGLAGIVERTTAVGTGLAESARGRVRSLLRSATGRGGLIRLLLLLLLLWLLPWLVGLCGTIVEIRVIRRVCRLRLI